MDILFLVLGTLIWLAIPCIEYGVLGGKVALFIAIMVLFFVFVIAYGILSVYKYFMAKLNCIVQNKIVEWDNGFVYKNKSVLTEFIFCGIFGILVGTVMIIKGISYLPSLCGAVGGAFVSFGWVLLGTKRIDKIKNGVQGFFLSHVGLIYNGKAEYFNGTTKGILSAEEKDGYLVLEILCKKKTETLKVQIPDDKKDDVNKFIADMKDFFNENKQKTT